jgi:hypothetical protein
MQAREGRCGHKPVLLKETGPVPARRFCVFVAVYGSYLAAHGLGSGAGGSRTGPESQEHRQLLAMRPRA